MGRRVVEQEVDGPVIVNDPELAIRAALDGIGVLAILADYVTPMIADSRLVQVLAEWMPPPSDGFFLYYPSRRQNPTALQVLIDFLRQNLREGARAARRKRTSNGGRGRS